ncbi:hypothetical protein AVEN_197332-1 [Araneus ventricosus]|uniref:Uncharacterized protein n=1 Tax=Araneus ventricosus TaxID=182803 RepID=A0A4Y2IU48_ARAVE|nr:hypothetical protein AVEN_197332-1 [Araneus ventricosus]
MNSCLNEIHSVARSPLPYFPQRPTTQEIPKATEEEDPGREAPVCGWMICSTHGQITEIESFGHSLGLESEGFKKRRRREREDENLDERDLNFDLTGVF